MAVMQLLVLADVRDCQACGQRKLCCGIDARTSTRQPRQQSPTSGQMLSKKCNRSSQSKPPLSYVTRHVSFWFRSSNESTHKSPAPRIIQVATFFQVGI